MHHKTGESRQTGKATKKHSSRLTGSASVTNNGATSDGLGNVNGLSQSHINLI